MDPAALEAHLQGLEVGERGLGRGSGEGSGWLVLGRLVSGRGIWPTLFTLALCLVIAMTMMYLMVTEKPADYDNPPRRNLFSKLVTAITGIGPKLTAEEISINAMMQSITIHDAMAQITTSINNEESLIVLKVLKLKLTDSQEDRSKKFALECCANGLLKHIFNLLKSIPPNDPRFSLSLDVINHILKHDDCFQHWESNGGSEPISFIIDSAIIVVRDSAAAAKLEVQPDIIEISATDTLETLELEDKTVFSEVSVSFMSSIYKAVLLLLKIAQYNNGKYQKLLTDRGAMDIVLSCLKLSINNRILKEMSDMAAGLSSRFVTPEDAPKVAAMFENFSKTCHKLTNWCFCALNCLLESNPANKREFVVKGHVDVTLKAIQSTMKSKYITKDEGAMIYRFGLFIILVIISKDPIAQHYNEFKVKQFLIDRNIQDVINFIRKNYAKNVALMDTVSKIEKQFLSDYA